MKKIAILLSMVFLLSACGLFTSTDHKDEITGVLTKQDAFDEYPGSHLLTDEDGEVYALNSTVLNLSSLQYLGNELRVQVEYDEENEVYSASGVSVLEVLEKEDGKANWVGYMNQDFGFKLKYYDNWELLEKDSEARFYSPTIHDLDDEESVDTILIRFNPLEGDETLEEFIERNGLDIFGVSNGEEDYLITDAKVGGNQQPGRKWKHKVKSDVHFFLLRDIYVYQVSFYSFEDLLENEAAFYEMLLEFQFVPFSDGGGSETPPDDDEITVTPDTADTDDNDDDDTNDELQEPDVPEADALESDALETYDYSSFSEFESLPYHFVAKYPASWYYSGESGSADGVMHVYAFSDESVTDENQFASLQVLSSERPNGLSQYTLSNGKKAYKQTSGSTFKVYVEVDDQLYLVEGLKEHQAMLEQIAASITHVE